MDKQKIYDKVKKHLLKQKKRSEIKSTDYDFSVEYNSMYRGPNNLKCGIGCLIPNDLYKKSMEGLTAGGVLDKYPKLKKHLGINSRKLEDADAESFLDDLQEIHDLKQPKSWGKHLKQFADSWGLKP